MVAPSSSGEGDERMSETITLRDAAKRLGVGIKAARKAAKRGEIPVIRVGRRSLVPRAAFERLLAEGNQLTRTA